jgi:hypothetical protein
VFTFTLKLHPPAPGPESRQPVSVVADGELPEYGQVWVWDMLYAQQLFAMGGGALASELSEVLELWAINMSSKIFQPHDHIRSKGHLQITEDLELVPVDSSGAGANDSSQVITLRVDGAAGELPSIRVSPDILPAEARHWLVIAVAQYFVDQNPLFARELPIHILAFRKYHADVNRPETAVAAEEAPFYAIQKAMEYFESAGHAG